MRWRRAPEFRRLLRTRVRHALGVPAACVAQAYARGRASRQPGTAVPGTAGQPGTAVWLPRTARRRLLQPADAGFAPAFAGAAESGWLRSACSRRPRRQRCRASGPTSAPRPASVGHGACAWSAAPQAAVTGRRPRARPCSCTWPNRTAQKAMMLAPKNSENDGRGGKAGAHHRLRLAEENCGSVTASAVK